MNNDPIIAIIIYGAFVYGFLLAWALKSDGHPFWTGYLDVITLRGLWKWLK